MNLQYWRDPRNINRRVARQILKLEDYNIQLVHIPGKTNGRADALLRLPGYDQGELDNRDVIALPDHLFARLCLTDNEEEQNEETLHPWIDVHKLQKLEGVWWKEARRVVTGDIEYRRSVVRENHEPPGMGHPGIARTTELTERYYWWPTIKKDVHDYVKGCVMTHYQ